MKFIKLYYTFLLICFTLFALTAKSQPAILLNYDRLDEEPKWQLKILERSEKPVVDSTHPDCKDIKYGFEGGEVIKCDGYYHWFPAEMSGDPFWVKMRIAYWRSEDGENWKRISTLYESSGINSPDNPRSNLWAPMPEFNEKENRWNLFYITYHGNAPGQVGTSYSGVLWRAVSKAPGRSGIAGPYENDQIILEKDSSSESWEGQQGPASISPYKLESGGWASFYCGHNYQPLSAWLVGIITAPELEGPWKRRPDLSPSTIDSSFVENPIIHKIPDGPYVAVYDNGIAKKNLLGIGFSYSEDGLHWAPGLNYDIVTENRAWEKMLRTPLGLIPEEDGTYTVFYTAQPKQGKFYPLSRLKVKIVQKGKEMNDN